MTEVGFAALVTKQRLCFLQRRGRHFPIALLQLPTATLEHFRDWLEAAIRHSLRK